VLFRNLGAVAAASLLFVSSAYPQTVTTQADQISDDAAELSALVKEANGDLYSLPHPKKMRLAEIILKGFIQETFLDPESVKAVITNDPQHEDVKAWQGLLNGGNKTYSGMKLCARINGKNRYGGYVGESKYLVMVMDGGRTQSWSSPYFNDMFHEMETNKLVEEECP
jgi:hypothetical protein